MRDIDDGAAPTDGSLALDVDDPRPRRNRPDSAPMRGAAAAKATSRSGATSSATLGGARGPNGPRGPSASMPQASGPRGPSASMAQASGPRGPAPQRAQAAATNVLDYGSGKMLGDDPLSDSFASDAGAPSLDIDEEADPRRRQKADSPPPPRELTAEEKRWNEVNELARYGAPPKNIAGAMGYWVRVTLRKRELDAELLSLSAQRKRTDDAAREAVAKLGEKLHAMRRDPRLKSLAKQIDAVASAEAEIGSAEKTGAQRKESIERERAQIEDEVGTTEAQAEPLRGQETELLARVEAIKAQAKQADVQRRRIEQELEAVRKKPAADPGALARLQAERDAIHGEVQTLGVELRPLEDDLSIVRKELAVHLRKLATLQQEQAAAATALERAQQAHRVTSGSARSARRDALSALANAAMDSGLAALAPNELKAVNDASERRDRKRAEEELYRAAAGSFNEVAYKQGMTLLVGGAGALLLALIVIVIF